MCHRVEVRDSSLYISVLIVINCNSNRLDIQVDISRHSKELTPGVLIPHTLSGASF